MGLLTLTQIPCHHVLANEIVLNLKYSMGLKPFFNINLGIGIIKKLLFCLYFWHISPCFYANFDWESSLDVELNFASNKYPLSILLMDLDTPKTRNTWKNVMMTSSSHFFRYVLFLGRRGLSKVCQVGTRWMWNSIMHTTSSPDRNLRKNTGRYVKNTNKKVVFSFPPKLINIIYYFNYYFINFF